MSQIAHLVTLLTDYHALPHHSNPTLAHALSQVQTWQKQRIRTTHHELFASDNTAMLAKYLINRIYANDDFKPLATQLLSAGNHALFGSGRLQKLIPKDALGTGILGVQAAITTIELDLQLAQSLLIQHGKLTNLPDDDMMYTLYRHANAQADRMTHIRAIVNTCKQSYVYFNSFILQNTFRLAKGVAYDNGYQSLYDFINDGLVAMKPIKHISDFTAPFAQKEMSTLIRIYGDQS